MIFRSHPINLKKKRMWIKKCWNFKQLFFYASDDICQKKSIFVKVMSSKLLSNVDEFVPYLMKSFPHGLSPTLISRRTVNRFVLGGINALPRYGISKMNHDAERFIKVTRKSSAQRKWVYEKMSASRFLLGSFYSRSNVILQRYTLFMSRQMWILIDDCNYVKLYSRNF